MIWMIFVFNPMQPGTVSVYICIFCINTKELFTLTDDGALYKSDSLSNETAN